MREYAIIAIGYNRPDSMKRLLNSLDMAHYGTDAVDLVISIDNSGTNAVEKCAQEFTWKYGEKIVRTFEQRQGLRNHILQCGKYTQQYRAVAVFEDDVIPAPGFYQFMKEAVPFYEQDSSIAGISLYTHLLNVSAWLPFQPSYGTSDVFFMQYAQSWGQVWMRDSWAAFEEWYQANSEPFTSAEGVPDSVSEWAETSWLKYHIRYCVEKNKYFVYPYQSLTTCCSDVGEHTGQQSTLLHVAMQSKIKQNYNFSRVNHEDAIVYDAFFERVLPEETMISGIPAVEICVNLYGLKGNTRGKRYVLSVHQLPYAAVCTYGLQLRPHEENVLFQMPGEEIALYDTKISKEIEKDNRAEGNRMIYYYRLFVNIRTRVRVDLTECMYILKRKFLRGVRKVAHVFSK